MNRKRTNIKIITLPTVGPSEAARLLGGEVTKDRPRYSGVIVDIATPKRRRWSWDDVLWFALSSIFVVGVAAEVVMCTVKHAMELSK